LRSSVGGKASDDRIRLPFEEVRVTTIRAFSALRPAPERASEVAAVPYDVVDTAEARRLAAGRPLSFLHVSRAEIDLPDGTDPYSNAVYAKAAENFDRLKHAAPMTVESEPSLYIYRLRMGAHEQTGIVGCYSLDEYEADVIRKHERTRKDKEDDRTRHMIALRAQTGPVFLTYRGRAEIDRLVEAAVENPPLYDLTAPDGVSHKVWRVGARATRTLCDAFGRLPALYIADGHHRAASAARARAELRAANPRHTGEEEYNFFLAVAFPANQVQILPYNRVVKGLNAPSPEAFLSSLEKAFALRRGASASPEHKGEIRMYLAGRWYGLGSQVPPSPEEPIASLDVSILQERLLGPILGIQDIRTDKRIDFVGGIRGTSELERRVDSKEADVAFSLFPVTVEELMTIADRGAIMPPKSTWFEPKLRDGLLSHLI
jgi:uncharacterized protein (DUF1015 family)